MKVNCRTCDICGARMGRWDLQYWFRRPVIKRGAPSIGMQRMDICDTCFAKMCIYIQLIKAIKTEEG